MMRDAPVAITCTVAEYQDQQGVNEVERLCLDSIAAAERLIYVENQDLTAHCIEQALIRCLQDTDGPDVVVVMPEKPAVGSSSTRWTCCARAW